MSFFKQSSTLAQVVNDLALKEYSAPGQMSFPSNKKYVQLRRIGSEIWFDTGDMEAAEKVWAQEASALTTNNALVNQMVQKGGMDDFIKEASQALKAADSSISTQTLIYEIGFLLNVRLALGLVEKFGAHVSVELHPDVAFDVEATVDLARRYHAICPDYFYVKVPYTQEGLLATRILSAEGIPVNLTIEFSARQNYLAARLANPAFVNIFLGRLNSLIEDNALGSPEMVGEKATLASDEMIKNLRASDVSTTRQIAASIRSGQQIPTLSGVDVYTIPPKSAGQYLEMEVSQEDLQYTNWRDLSLELHESGNIHPSILNVFWDIDKDFIAFTEDIVKNVESLQAGSDLDKLDRKHGVNLFHDWSNEERVTLREQGKIPQLSDWQEISADTLMSMAALESFVKDQIEVDERIKQLI